MSAPRSSSESNPLFVDSCVGCRCRLPPLNTLWCAVCSGFFCCERMKAQTVSYAPIDATRWIHVAKAGRSVRGLVGW